jgi:hypothetical protein
MSETCRTGATEFEPRKGESVRELCPNLQVTRGRCRSSSSRDKIGAMGTTMSYTHVLNCGHVALHGPADGMDPWLLGFTFGLPYEVLL